MAILLSPFEWVVDFTVEPGVYLESGFMDYFSVAPCNENTFKPAFLNYNTLTQAIIDTADFPLQGRVQKKTEAPFFSGHNLPARESLAVGCVDKVSSITRCSIVYNQGEPTYCDNDEIRRIKFIQSKVKPSNFDGKLQLFVQSLYGSLRRDYSTDESHIGRDYPLYIGSTQLHYLYTGGTTGLLTGADYRYFLIHISNIITATELIPSNSGEILRQHLIAHASSLSDDEIQRVEAVILSTCTVSATVQDVVLSLSTLLGSPLAYGWHFNYAGSRANVILHRANYDNDVLLDQMHHAYHYQIDFTESAGVISASLTTVSSDKTWYSVGSNIAFRPSYFSGNMSALVNPMDTPFSGWDTNSNWGADVYCYYDNDTDELILTGFNNVYTAPHSVAETISPPFGNMQGQKIEYVVYAHETGESNTKTVYCGEQSLSFTTADSPSKTVYLLDYNGGFTASNPDLMRPPYDAGLYQDKMANFQYVDDWAIDQGLITNVNGETGETITIGGEEKPIYIYYYPRYNTGVDKHNVIYTDNKSVCQSITIPFNNCSAAFIGQRSTAQPAVTSDDFFTQNSQGQGICVFYRFYNDAGNKIVLNEWEETMYGGRLVGGSPGPGFITPSNDIDVLVDFKTIAETLESETSTSTSFRDKYFNISFVTEPVGYFYAHSKKSMMGAYQHEIDSGYGLINVDYPFDSAVGWA